MDRDELVELVRHISETSPLNRVATDVALRPDLAGLRLYDPPIVGVAAADDPLFLRLRRPAIVGPQFRQPRDWLPEAESVLSFFFPVSEKIGDSNSADPREPSHEWLHARIEGQAYIAAVCDLVADALVRQGYKAVTPSNHPDFRTRRFDAPDSDPSPPFVSNWSERHVAHVAGLGTFGLSAGLITEKGMAGRFGSVVTSLRLEPTPRPYSGPFDYCTRCGACMRRCTNQAITAAGKDHIRCKDFLIEVSLRYPGRYGCGKCQVKVPCSRGIPPDF